MNTNVNNQSEFSASVLEFQPDDVMIQASPFPRAARVVLYTVVAAFTALVVWACVAKLDRVVSVQGKLTTEDPHIIVRPFAKGTVQKVHVKIGSRVRAGDVVVTLDPTFTQADLKRITQRREQNWARYQRLLAELHERPIETDESSDDSELWSVQETILTRRLAIHEARVGVLDEDIQAAKAAINTNKTQQEAQVDAISLQAEMVDSATSNAEKLSAQQTLLLAENEYRRLTQLGEELSAGLRGKLASRDAYLQSRQESIVNDLAEVLAKIDDLDEEYAKAKKLAESVVLRVPENVGSAAVLELHELRVGQVVQELEPLVTLVPLDKPLVAEAMIPAREIAFIHEGQSVRTKLETFPFQKHGTINASVSKISEDAFRDSATGQPVYRCELELEGGAETLENVPTSFQLLPGMQLTAEVKVGTRRAISYFTYPIIRSLDESLNER